MRRALALAVLVLAASAAPAAQVGRLLDRARQAAADVRGTVSADAPAPATVGGQPAPAVDATRFLQMRYWPQRGQFYFGTPGDHVVFPPEGLAGRTRPGEYVLRDDRGRVVARQALGTVEPTGSAAFVRLGTYGEATGRWPLADGAYTLDLVVDGHIAGRIPFAVAVESGSDPFAPRTIYHRDGPWRTLGYLEHETERRDYHLTFTCWISRAELGSDTGAVQASLTHNGREVARSSTRAGHVETGGEWGQVTLRLDRPAPERTPNPTFFTIDDVEPGAYVLTVSRRSDGRPIRSFALTGTSDGFAPHPRSAADHEPRYDYLAPRRLGAGSMSRAYSVTWAAIVP